MDKYELAFEQYEPFAPEAENFQCVREWAARMTERRFPLDFIIAQVYSDGWYAAQRFGNDPAMDMEQIDGRSPRQLSKEDYARLDD